MAVAITGQIKVHFTSFRIFDVIHRHILNFSRLFLGFKGLLRVLSKHEFLVLTALLEEHAWKAGLLMVGEFDHWCWLLIRLILVLRLDLQRPFGTVLALF